MIGLWLACADPERVEVPGSPAEQVAAWRLAPHGLASGAMELRGGGVRWTAESDGVVVSERAGGVATTWPVSPWGRGFASSAPVAPVWEVVDGGLEAAVGDATTRWTARPQGVAVRWQVDTRPEGVGPLTLDLGGAEGWRGHGAGWWGPGALRVDALQVRDAAGQRLPAHFRLRDGRRWLEVDDDGALYPLDVDPLITTLAATLQADPPKADGWFGQAVAVRGDLVAVGLPGDFALDPTDGRVELYRRDVDGAFDLVATLTAPAGAVDFGGAVAIGDGLVVVGAHESYSDAGRAYVYEKDLGGFDGWGLVATLAPPGVGAGDLVGRAVAAWGDRILVGAPGVDDLGSNAGAAYLYDRNGVLLDTLLASDGAASDGFGIAVGLDADRALVGASGRAGSTGGAYVFARNLGGADAWGEEVAIEPPLGVEVGARFGDAVAIDGMDAVIGAPLADAGLGRAWQLGLDEGGPSAWGTVGSLSLDPGAEATRFGESVAVSDGVAVVSATGQGGPGVGLAAVFERGAGVGATFGLVTTLAGGTSGGDTVEVEAVALDGSTLVFGHARDAVGGLVEAGQVAVYTRSATSWELVAEPEALDPLSGMALGFALGVDDVHIAVGAPLDDEGGAGTGSVFVFSRDETGNWALLERVLSPAPEADAQFGYAVDLDEGRLVVGAPSDDEALGANSGRAWLFERNLGGLDHYGLRTELLPDSDGLNQNFGHAVAVGADHVFVSAPRADDVATDAGEVHVFERNLGGADAWGRAVRLTASDFGSGDEFGKALAADGPYLLVGAPTRDAALVDVGGAYVFTWDGSWTESAILSASIAGTGDQVGTALDVSGDTIVLGVSREDGAGVDRGHAEVWRRQSGLWDRAAVLAPSVVVDDAEFGFAVATAGNSVAVAAPGRNADAGQVDVFEEQAGVWALGETVVDGGGEALDRFGRRVALGAGRLVVTSLYADGAVADAGALFVFEGDAPLAPEARDDDVAGTEDTTLVVGAPGVLANDFDGNGDGLTAALAVAPLHGSVVVAADGGFTYQPAVDWNGEDSFEVEVTDGHGGASRSTVRVELAPVEDVPLGRADAFVVTEDVAYFGSVLTNDSDGDGDPLSAVLLSGPSGALVWNVDGTFVYTPVADAVAPDGFTYAVSDGHSLSVAVPVTLSILPVADAPVAVVDGPYAVTEDTPLAVGVAAGVLANDRDVDGDLLAARLVAPPARGTLVLGTLGSFTYTPNLDQYGPDSFTYQADDGSLRSATTTVNLVVSAVDDAPRALAAPVLAPISEDTSLAVGAPGLLASFSEPEGEPIHLVVSKADPNAVTTVSDTGAWSVTPNADMHGTLRPEVRACDGALCSDPIVLVVTVLPVNDLPRLVGALGPFAVAEDGMLEVNAPGILGAYVDPEGDPLTASVLVPPVHGALTVGGGGGFTYTPDPDHVGADTFDVAACDAAGCGPGLLVRVVTGGVNDPPTLVGSLAYAFDEDVGATIEAPGVLDAFEDPEGDEMTAQLVAGLDPALGTVTIAPDGSLGFTPSADATGSGTLQVQACDGLVCSDVLDVEVDVLPINDAPRGVETLALAGTEDVAVRIAAGVAASLFEDVEGDPIHAAWLPDPLGGSLSVEPGGDLVAAPPADLAGPWALSVVGCDAVACGEPVEVVVELAPAPDAPRALGVSSVRLPLEDQLYEDPAPGLSLDFVEVDGEPMGFVLVSAATRGVVDLRADGTFTYLSLPDTYGLDSFEVQACDDDGCSAPAWVELDVLGVNDLPRPISLVAELSCIEDGLGFLPSAGTLFSDPEGDGVSLLVTQQPTHGSALPAFYVPLSNYFGPDAFQIAGCDAEGCGASMEFVVEVSSRNDPPGRIQNVYAVQTDEDVAVALTESDLLVCFLDVDPEPLALVVGVALDPAVATWDGTWLTPAPDVSGFTTFEVHACDPAGVCTNDTTVEVEILPVDDLPRQVGELHWEGVEDTLVDVPAPGIAAAFQDLEGDPFTVSLVGGVPAGLDLLIVGADGAWTALPSKDATGRVEFEVAACGSAGCGPTALASVDFAAVDDPPVASPDGPYLGREGEPLVVDAAAGVLANDVDVDGDPLSAVLLVPPALGTVDLRADGSFTYVATDPDLATADDFLVAASDGRGLSAPVAVSVELVAVDDPPALVAIEGLHGVEDERLTWAQAAWSAAWFDVEGDPFGLVVLDAPLGWIVEEVDGGDLELMPGPDDAGVFALLVMPCEVADPSVCGTPVEVEIDLDPVDDAPRSLGGVPVDLVEDTPALVDLGVFFVDVEGDPVDLMVVGSDGLVAAALGGTWVDVLPDPDRAGDGTLVVVACGVTCGSEVAIPVLVAPVDDPPRPVADVEGLVEDTPLVLAAPGWLANDLEVDGETLVAAGFEAPAGFVGGVAVDGAVDLLPPPNGSGLYLATLWVSDGISSVPASVALDVAAVDDPPAVGLPEATWSTDEDLPYAFAAPGVAAWFVDPDGPVSVEVVVAPAHGTFEVGGDGSVLWTPERDWFGDDVVTLRGVEAGVTTAEVDLGLVVRPVDDPPRWVGADPVWRTDEDVAIDIDLHPLVVDPDGGEPTFVAIASDPGVVATLDVAGSAHLEPAPDVHGTFLVWVTAVDGEGHGADLVAVLEVQATPDAPVAWADVYATVEDEPLVVPAEQGVLANDVDPDGDPLEVVLLDPPASGAFSLEPDGSLAWTPEPDAVATEHFTYVVTDGTLVSEAVEVRLDVVAVDDPPRAADDAYATDEGVALDVPAPGVLANDLDVEGDFLVAVLVDGTSNGDVDLGPDGALSYVPDPGFTGTDHLLYEVVAGGQSSGLVSVDIEVVPENRPPIVGALGFSTDEDLPLEVSAPGLLETASDPDGDLLSAALAVPPSHGDLVVEAGGAFSYTPDPDWNGTDSFSVAIADGAGHEVLALVDVDVYAVNDPPVAVDDTWDVARGASLAVEAEQGLLVNDHDVDLDVLEAVLLTSPSHGALTPVADGSFTYVPTPGYVGTDAFSYAADDGLALSEPAVVVLRVLEGPTDTADVGCDDPSTWYHDYDGDGFGSARTPLLACSQPEAYVLDRTDCDDLDPEVYPGATEVPNDGLDQDCDGGDTEVSASGACACNGGPGTGAVPWGMFGLLAWRRRRVRAG